ncbi:2-polyprenyl-6-methoxyphenol hydroxylase [Amycolatopsis sacchari]|uniref:2-polyprenyl-6-methoxyphenol hydroxylase n=1 Tax=Amycolatopsis sacchari TaxID=115433 RepID=A0A1I3SYT2_9PSEU|nr:FAD-dependent monooxygenase [Amycolatopsis sacchari]SFJ62616.1 2-polyprenyl-6-methoxyphenol hydroxylase [Amycolatopsis sacchari]
MTDVLIAGAGPTGLWLAAELRLQGVAVTVLEARRERSPHSKALTLHPRTLEIFAMRGIADRFTTAGLPVPTGHFGALENRLDFAVLDTPFPYTLFLPQVRTEELLEEHARALGADIRWGHRVTGLAQDADGVTVEVEGGERLHAQYVVGCDGTRSTVRQAAGIGFPGTDATVWGWLGDVVLDEPPAQPVNVAGEDGGVMLVPLPGGISRIVGHTPEDQGAHPGELTFDELRAKTTRVLGTDFGMRDPHWLSRFGNATRQAVRYRSGRVFLAGDAAHMHFPAGGVGLNVGVQDATNLGWKLAAAVHGTAEDGLLDSYHAERHPVGAALLEHTRAQTALMTAYTPEGRALRSVLSGLIAEVPELSRVLAERLAALDVAYPSADPGAHPLTGTRAPDLALTDGSNLLSLLRSGEPVRLDGIQLVGAPPQWAGVRSALVRPDGYVAWAN